jgi:hypothetical protein
MPRSVTYGYQRCCRIPLYGIKVAFGRRRWSPDRPVLAPLRAAGPAAAHNKGSMTKDETTQPLGVMQNDHAVVVHPGRPSPQPILVTGIVTGQDR